jgi:hypothetical protein
MQWSAYREDRPAPSLAETIRPDNAHIRDGPPPAYMSRVLSGNEMDELNTSLLEITVQPTFTQQSFPQPVSGTSQSIPAPQLAHQAPLQPVRRAPQAQASNSKPSFMKRIVKALTPLGSSGQNLKPTPFTGGKTETCTPFLPLRLMMQRLTQIVQALQGCTPSEGKRDLSVVTRSIC